MGGVQFLRKIAYRSWGLKNRAPGDGFGRLFGIKIDVKTGKMRFQDDDKSELF